MNCPNCQTENPKAARFCMHCGASLPQACIGCGAAMPIGARFCPVCGTAQAGSAPQPPMTSQTSASEPLAIEGDSRLERLQRLVPKEFAERLLETRGKVERERRQVTILFSDIKGSTRMAEHMDPEEVMEIMNGAFDVLIEPVYRHEGTLARLMGDAILAFFGAPIAHEDDPERAVRAALEILEGVKGYAARLEHEWGISSFAVRVGIHTGLVVVGEVGSDLRVEYTAMGDAINLAARLEQNAPIGGILISRQTYQHLRGRFDVQLQPPLSVKGKSEPVTVFTVLRARPRTFHGSERGVEGVETPLVGRQQELAFLQGQCVPLLDPTVHQNPSGSGAVRFITIYGEAGVGKSRLLFEYENWLEAQPQTVEILRGRAIAMNQHSPYGVLRAMLQEHFKIMESDSAAEVRRKFEIGLGNCLPLERVHLLGHVLGFGFADTPAVLGMAGSGNLAPLAMADLGAWIRSQAAKTGNHPPLLIFLEDLHWADDPTLDFFENLVGELDDERLLVIGLARGRFSERRPNWGRQAGFARLDLAPLSEEQSRELVDAIFQRLIDPPQTLRSLIIERAEGNPFYVEELVMMLIGDGAIVQDASGWRIEMERLEQLRVPTTLVGVLQARLDALPESERQVLQRASVIGRHFWDTLLQALADEPVGTDGLCLPTTQDRASLDATIEQLGQRQLVFQQPLSAFSGAHEYLFKHAILHDVTYETVLLKLRRLYHRRAAEWLEANCSERLDEYAALIAGHYELGRESQKAIAWLKRAGEAALAVGAFTDALQAFQRALALTGENDAQQALLMSRAGMAHSRMGDFEQARPLLEQSAELARSQDDWPTLTYALRHLSFINQSIGEKEKSRRQAEECLDAARRSGSQKDLAAALMRMAEYPEDEASSMHLLEQALEAFQRADYRTGVATCLMNIGIHLCVTGHHPEALPYLEDGLEAFRQINDRWGVANCLENIGTIHMADGEYQQAIPLLEEALRIEREIGDRESMCFALSDLGISYLQMEQYHRALEYLRPALQASSTVGVLRMMLENLAALAHIYAHQGERIRPARLYGVLIEHPGWYQDWREITSEGLSLLRQAMPEAELEMALAEGKALGLEALVETELEQL
ncbi:MAG: adenylate/guanylate cyclase domain-containing protein [Chloroflexota bacterium]